MLTRRAVGTSHASLLLLAVVALSLTCGGCGGRQSWNFALQPHNGKAMINMDGVTLIFEGIPFDHPPGGIRAPTTGSLAIAGSGSSQITVTVDGKSFKNSYTGGANTMTFEGITLKLLDRGTRLEVGTQEFDLTGEKKTIVVGEDGAAHVQGPG